jgi:hypothetical protein
MGVGGIRFIATILPFRSTYYPAFCPTKLRSLLGSVNQISRPNLFPKIKCFTIYTNSTTICHTAAFEIKELEVGSIFACRLKTSLAFEPPKQKLISPSSPPLLPRKASPLVHINHLLDLAA